MNAQKLVAPGASEDQVFAAASARALAAVVEAGAKILIEEPWRVSRILPAADQMTIEDLVGQIAGSSRAGPSADLNRAIALAQLHVALKSARFHLAWTRWRDRSER